MSQGSADDIPNIVLPVRQSARLQQRAQRIIRDWAQQRRIAAIPEGEEGTDPPDDISALSDGSFDDVHIMSSQQPKGILQKMLGEAFMEPILSPTVIQVQAFRQAISNVLSTITDLRHATGSSWIIEEEGNYKLRLSIGTGEFTMPTLPDLPPYNDKANRDQMGHWRIQSEYYHSTQFWNSECLDVIQKKFPGGLTVLESHPDILPNPWWLSYHELF